MKALSLTQPHASLVALRVKRFETRSWSTSYRGPLAIHAAKNFPLIAKSLCYRDVFSVALTGTETPKLADIDDVVRALPRGAIVAVATLAVCHRVEDIRDSLGSPLEHEFGNYSDGRWAFRLDDVVALPQPIECKGALGLWPVPLDLIDEVIVQAVRGQDVAVGGPTCRACGCTDNTACEDGCYWVEPDLCSSCVEVPA